MHLLVAIGLVTLSIFIHELGHFLMARWRGMVVPRFSIFGIGTATIPLARRLRGTAIGGVGLAALSTDGIGGDLFVPSCRVSPGVRPALLLGTQIDYAVNQLLRLTAFPLTFQVQPAFDGVRASPRDASGIWMRFGIGIGAGVDL